MTKLPQRLNLPDMQVRWASIIDPVVSNVLLNGRLIENQDLGVGSNVINHKLGRKQRGYIIADQDGIANIYRSMPLDGLTLTLTSDANVTVSIWCF